MVLAVQLAIVQYSSHGSNTGISLARVLDNYGCDFRQSEFKIQSCYYSNASWCSVYARQKSQISHCYCLAVVSMNDNKKQVKLSRNIIQMPLLFNNIFNIFQSLHMFFTLLKSGTIVTKLSTMTSYQCSNVYVNVFY